MTLKEILYTVLCLITTMLKFNMKLYMKCMHIVLACFEQISYQNLKLIKCFSSMFLFFTLW